jgi:hypothetical protein
VLVNSVLPGLIHTPARDETAQAIANVKEALPRT